MRLRSHLFVLAVCLLLLGSIHNSAQGQDVQVPVDRYQALMNDYLSPGTRVVGTWGIHREKYGEVVDLIFVYCLRYPNGHWFDNGLGMPVYVKDIPPGFTLWRHGETKPKGYMATPDVILEVQLDDGTIVTDSDLTTFDPVDDKRRDEFNRDLDAL